MRRCLRLFHVPRLYRGGLARKGRRAVADGGRHARFCFRGATEFPAVLPDQSERRPRWPCRDDAVAAGVTRMSKNKGRWKRSCSNAQAIWNCESIRTISLYAVQWRSFPEASLGLDRRPSPKLLEGRKSLNTN